MRTLGVSGELLVRLRESMGWNQTQAAKHYGINRAYLSRIESGDRQPSPAVAQSIARALGLTPGALFFGADPE